MLLAPDSLSMDEWRGYMIPEGRGSCSNENILATKTLGWDTTVKHFSETVRLM
jgi:hypothetical protein